ncbi:hypothetical protein [Tateyamaria sp. ANG-S1]|uniref:hypothetical protein n=1 Tax=Tateyamaria sp. ANG-S1 TaxID=1577905 RepID=UPI00057D487F|nr:hypothetical protein [Tateyamaria sp. ANG-S1]KIC48388.1 hypothetical protein RA29_11460 [Tateyamaria sp. ANG-S1]
MTNAMPDPAPNLVWADIDGKVELSNSEICDLMVARQLEEGHELDAPCAAAQELLDQWESEGDDLSVDWAAARQRHRAARRVSADGEEPEYEAIENQPELTEDDRRNLASIANAIAMGLFPFVREMIEGNAPGTLIDKQFAGTGSGKLESAFSIIASGSATPAVSLPEDPEEMTKRLLPVLRSGRPNVFFDNVNHAVDSGELASAMTADWYEARILGKSETIAVEVRCQWVVTGIQVQLSKELARRFSLIFMDPKTDKPENREDFRHADLTGWVRKNRGRLVWACLTLVQNWVAGGRQPGSVNMASYTSWAQTMSGILEAAGILCLRENASDMSARASTENDPKQVLLAYLASFPDDTLFVAGSVPKRLEGKAQSVKVILEDFFGDEAAGETALRIAGWGYDRDGAYGDPQKIAAGMRTIEDMPHSYDGGQFTLVKERHKGANALTWRLDKTADPEKQA